MASCLRWNNHGIKTMDDLRVLTRVIERNESREMAFNENGIEAMVVRK